MLLETAAAGAALAGGGMYWAVCGRAATLLAPSVWRGPRGRRSLALTFDDGPSESTPRLLEILERQNVRATFFLCGTNIHRLPEVARAVRDAGHEIASHGDRHPYFVFQSPGFLRADIAGGLRALQDVTGVRTPWFRPPYGLRWFGLRRIYREFGLTGVQWTVIARDWELDAPGIVAHCAPRAEPGAVFCFHDGRALAVGPDIANTLEAVRELLPRWRDAGYRFETVGQMFRPR
jgi:peptidoglycan/xylan/chitin deacetylase (PgdA/CDA1 family)